MKLFIKLLVLPAFLLLFIDNAKAATEEIEAQPETVEINDTENLIIKWEEIQTERNALKEKISNKEKEISSINDKSKKEEAKNEKIELSRKSFKLAAEETAYRNAIGIKQPDYSWNTFKELPDLLIRTMDAPSDYIKYYIAAGEKYNVEWTVLAAIHKIETNFSTHPTMISYAGAVGHMQFIPATWKAYGVDADGDGKADPWSLPDAIFSAANYLSANGFKNNPRKAIWHYNHAEWYVNDVLRTAATIKNEI